MWRFGCRSEVRRRFSSSALRYAEDEGDWSYSSEWWGSVSDGQTVFRSTSDHGNGVVSVVSYPSSRPATECWLAKEAWLQQRHAKIHRKPENDCQFKILGYQWRTLRFNDNTRQSTSKVMTACRKSDPDNLYLMQQPHCLAVPYLKSMVSAGLTTLASSGFDLNGAVTGKRTMKVLCVGHGGGSLPLFIASKIKGAHVDIVEIDPIVISASVQSMGFPISSVKGPSEQISNTQPPDADQLLYGDFYDRLSLHQSDAEDFMLKDANIYDLILVDAYDGDDIFPHKLWDRRAPFLLSLRSKLHPVHGTVVINLHADSDVLDPEGVESILPMGKYVSKVCRAYKECVGMAFTVAVPWLCNISLVACNGGPGSGGKGVVVSRDIVLRALVSNSYLVDIVLDLPFPCLHYIKRGFALVD